MRSIADPVEGLVMACLISRKLAMMMSVEEASGIVTFVGNQEIVSQIRSALVSQIQIL